MAELSAQRWAAISPGGAVKRRPARAIVQILVAVFLAGCFSYVPAELGTVAEGGEVRLHLTRQAVAELPDIPKQSGSVLTGTILRMNANELVVRVPIAVQMDGLLARTLEQEVPIQADNIVRLETREFNRVRTALVLAGGGVGVALIIASFVESEAQNSSLPPVEGEGAGMRRSAFRILSIPLR